MSSARSPELAERAAPPDEATLEERLSRPDDAVATALAALGGDLLVLGAGGKMGLSVARMARRALDASGRDAARVVAVSRFAAPGAREDFERAGVETLGVDLLADGAVERLPDAAGVVYLVGMKFGSQADPAATWATNTFLAGLVARRFAGARIVALSTGNVYPLMPVEGGGATEATPPAPIGEYAWSCLGRERLFTHYSTRRATPVTLIRLNYANDLRYGVLVDLAKAVRAGGPIDLSMGHVNVIWQGDANRAALRAFDLCASPPAVLNVTGPETASVRDLAARLAARLGARPPRFVGSEAATVLLSDASRLWALAGRPAVPLGRLVEWTADWLARGGRTLGKPTHFQVRTGEF
jgi:nucleoside-diphosphate-sugar epimerase